jgi:hypothetical protein
MRRKNHIVTKNMVGLFLGEAVSTKKTHHRKGCGWLASRIGSKYKKNTHIVAKDVVGLQVGDIKNDSLTKMKTY